MADYNIYRVVRLDIGDAPIPIYVGMTDRTYEERWVEHRQSCNGVYKINCKGGLKGQIKDPDTSHGRRANASLFHFIRDNLNGIDGLGTLWDFQPIINADKQTEDDWIDLYISMGYELFNLKQGEGHTITQRCKAGVDLTGCTTIEEVAARREEYDVEQVRKKEERMKEAKIRKKKRDRKDIPTLVIRFEICLTQIESLFKFWDKKSDDFKIKHDDILCELEVWFVDYKHYMNLGYTENIREAVSNIETLTHALKKIL